MRKSSPVLLKAYEDGELSLEQLMAFCLVEDHKRQEEVWTTLEKHWNKGPDAIRRMLGRSPPGDADRVQAADGKAVHFKRNDRMLEIMPAGVIIFPGSGITGNLADKAKKLSIPLLDHREGGA